jgi:hypothetical protein
MLTLKQSLFGFVGIALIFGAIALALPRPTVGQKPDAPATSNKPPQNVNVVNTPLPVTGTIEVGNPGNSPLPVRDVDAASRQPFQAEFHIPLFDVPRIQVPAGKRLVFEFVSMDVASDLVCSVSFVQIETIVGGTRAAHIMPTSHIVAGTRNVDSVGQQIKLYADPGTQASVVYGVRGDGPCNSNGTIAVSGYFENVTQ